MVAALNDLELGHACVLYQTIKISNAPDAAHIMCIPFIIIEDDILVRVVEQGMHPSGTIMIGEMLGPPY